MKSSKAIDDCLGQLAKKVCSFLSSANFYVFLYLLHHHHIVYINVIDSIDAPQQPVFCSVQCYD